MEQRMRALRKEHRDAGDAGRPSTPTEEVVERNGHFYLEGSAMTHAEGGKGEKDVRQVGPLCAAIVVWMVFFMAMLLSGVAVVLWAPFLLFSCCGFWVVYKMFC